MALVSNYSISSGIKISNILSYHMSPAFLNIGNLLYMHEFLSHDLIRFIVFDFPLISPNCHKC